MEDDLSNFHHEDDALDRELKSLVREMEHGSRSTGRNRNLGDVGRRRGRLETYTASLSLMA